MEYLICNVCNEKKPLTKEHYHVRKDSSFGWRKVCKPCHQQRQKEYRQSEEGKILCRERTRRWRENNIERYQQNRIKWEIENYERRSLQASERYQKRKHIIRKRKYERYHNDILYRLKMLCSKRLRDAVKGTSYSKDTKKMIGCTFEELKTHLESQFKDDMSWDNWGYYGWHIDHIIPLSSANNEDELLKLSHYTNLQPLWGKENMRKNDKII